MDPAMLLAVIDNLCSPRTSTETQHKAIQDIERIVADVFLSSDQEIKLAFSAIQDSLHANLACHLLPWIAQATRALDALTKKAEPDVGVPDLSKHLSIALSILQAVALNHRQSKFYLARRHSLEILLDLLLISRHAPAPPATQLPLTSVVLDTLLAVLVDLPTAIRVFESASGLQAVVKILKRAGTPREVRMKCLEFLYFYLLDETTGHERTISRRRSSSFSSLSPQPVTPPDSSASLSTGSPSRNRSHSQPRIPSPLKKLDSSKIIAARKLGHGRLPSGSAPSPSASSSRFVTPSTLSKGQEKGNPQLLMLRKPLDFVPLSPRKPPSMSSRSRQPSGLSQSAELPDEKQVEDADDDRKTTEEKKELLGQLLGNVDALVDGVRRAGVWGLG